MAKKRNEVEAGTGNVFADLGYADARERNLKVELAIDHLAGKEMAVGRYYQSNQQYVGAINRYRVVIERYQTTTHVPEALHRLVECYLSLGVKQEAQEAAAVLGYNFPGSEWYQDSYALLVDGAEPAPVQRGVMERTWDSMTSIF